MNEDRLATRWEGRTPEHWRTAWRIPALTILETTPSTNDTAMRLAARGEPAGTTVIADSQTRGRGREGRRWIDTPGQSLLMSTVLRGEGATDPSVMPLRAGLAVALTIEELTGLETRIKWPNDVLAADGRKLAGALCEGSSGAGQAWLVTGIGINVWQDEKDFEDVDGGAAASIRMLGAEVTRADLARRVLDALRPFRIGPPPLDDSTLRALEARDALRDRQITVNGDVACTAAGITAYGELRIRRDGETTTIRTGTVRPAGPFPPDPQRLEQPANPMRDDTDDTEAPR